jgi:hypothetical protein
VFEVDVEQTDPMIERPHTWTVHLWTSQSNSNEITPAQLGWIMADPFQAGRPDLRAGCEEVGVRYWDCAARSSKYTLVVVEVIEMTGGDRPEVYATRTHALAFENGSRYEKPVEIPLCAYAEMPAPASAIEPPADGPETKSTEH